MVRTCHAIQNSLLIASAFLVISGPAKADALQGLGSALTGVLNQSVQNTQGGVQAGVQNTVQSNTPHPNEVNAARAVANNTASISPRMLCSQIPAELRTKYTQACASFDISNPCSALPVAGSLTKQQAHLQSLCNAQQSLTNLQGQAAAKVTPSSGQIGTEVNQQLQGQINSLISRH